MGQAMANLKLDYVNEYVTAPGSCAGISRELPSAPLPGDVGSVEFMTTYQAYLGEDRPSPTAKIEGTLAD